MQNQGTKKTKSSCLRWAPVAAACINLTLHTGCASSIAPDDDDAPLEGNAGPNVNHEVAGDATLTSVDAVDDVKWVFWDLDTGAQLTVEQADEDESWDLAFQRFHIMSNGGASGSGGVQISKVDDAVFSDLDRAPASGWEQDAPDGDDDDLLNDFVFGDWYAYDPTTHTLSPESRVYMVRSTQGDAFKISMQDYYSSAGTSGTPTFLWKKVEG